MYEWIGLCILIIFVFVWLNYYYKEGLDNTPMEIVQSQQGEIESINKKLIELQLNKEMITEIEDEANTTMDQINKLQENIPDPQVKKYAQE